VLFGLVQAWRGLLQVTGAQVLVADHAPTAILAARTLGVPVLMFSTGFYMPPAVYPLPNMRSWCLVPEQILKRCDDQARDSINAVLRYHERPEITATAALFQVAEPAILTFPELDHYPARGVFTYWGSLPHAEEGLTVSWRHAEAPKWFVYVRPQTPHHLAVLEAILSLGHQAAVYFPGAPDDFISRFQGTNVQVFRQPLNLRQMTQEADAAVCYSSVQTTTAFLLAGKPLLLLPWHLEQFMLAMRVRDMGCGQVVEPGQSVPNLHGLLTDVLANPVYRRNAQGFAAKYRGFEQSQVLAHLVRRIEGLTQTQ
jgi:UDP:flavonoid glycosyltransferase YjiC (YdhE family)